MDKLFTLIQLKINTVEIENKAIKQKPGLKKSGRQVATWRPSEKGWRQVATWRPIFRID